MEIKSTEFKTLQEVVAYNEDFVKQNYELRSSLSPMLAVCKGNEVTVMVLLTDREHIHSMIQKAKKAKPNWSCFMTEAYAKTIPKDSSEDVEGTTNGQLEREFQGGSKNIKEVVIIQCVFGDEKACIQFDLDSVQGKKVLTNRSEFKDFTGYMEL